ncbi:hypothetical protein L6164_014884 [Bauhinia variegata]|uniref:Uncharacterized protein n=1 Tax=Bauhinia variegata TaxID=167791 RepID=A0ACB9NKX0_BAUVA|nr:hypothetical protein L6164_014884 [Bauhinia variegata]
MSSAKMPIRRLKLDYSDDEDEPNPQPPSEPPPPPPLPLEIEDDFQPHPQIVTHQCPAPNAQNPRHFPSEPLEISDDEEFIDVSDNLSPPSPPPPQELESRVIPPAPGTDSSEDSGCPINDSLRRLGLSLKREWLDACIRELESSVRGFAGFDVTTKAKLCFEQFLFSDMNYCGGGVLPANVHSMHLADLPGPYVLQVDEIINISCPLRSRYQQAPPGLKRCLKLSMTDGIQRVFGMEYRPIHALDNCVPSGVKVAISNVHVRRGLLMLVPETIEVLGGLVEQLDAARKRLVDELNKPSRGKRTKIGVLPPLAARATLAAWPSSRVDDHGLNSSTLQSNDSIQANNQGAGPRQSSTHTRRTEDTIHVAVQNAAPNSTLNLVSNIEVMHLDTDRNVHPESSANSMANRLFPAPVNVDEIHMNALNVTRANSVGNQSSHTVSDFVEGHLDTSYTTRENSVISQCPPNAQNAEKSDSDRIPVARENDLGNGSSSSNLNIEDIDMVDSADHPLILSGEREIPFTYLASLSAKWAAMKEKAPSVQGKIKCFLTGVKGFQYKQRTAYELQVYVDDGSLISEILVDHKVVQKGIGYSPQEVTAALSSPDKKIIQNIKDTLRKFQAFLTNFEGVMLVEFNGKSSLPIALEMNQGCSRSDAWLLLRRLKSLLPAQVRNHHPSDPVDISP